MPRRKKPHHHEIVYLPYDPETPFDALVCVYTRLSDDDPQSVSHAHQEAAALEWARSNGKAVTAIYRDWRTGFDPNRLAFKALIEDAHAGKHKGVVFYDHYRFHRGVTGAYPVVLLHQHLPTYTFHATVGGYDITQIGIWAGISGLEAETTRRRSTEQRRRRAADGQFMAGSKPYWIDRDRKTRQAIINPERAQHVLHAITLYARGDSMTEVAEYLTRNAPVRDSGYVGDVWNGMRVRRLLRNPALWGQLPYARGLNITERRDGELVTVRRVANPDAVPFTVDALIHHTELERVECTMAGGCPMDEYPAGETLDKLIRSRSQREGGRPYTIEHPLRRRVMCPCGWKMGFRKRLHRDGVTEADYGYLYCARYHGAKQGSTDRPGERGGCGIRCLSTRKLWPVVRELVIGAIQQPEALIDQVRDQILAEAAGEARDARQDSGLLDELSTRLAELNDQENRLYERWDSGEISKVVYERQVARIATQRREAEESKRQLLSYRVIYQRADRQVVQLREGLAEAAGLPFERLTLQHWTDLIASLVAYVSLDQDGVPAIRWHQGI